MLLIALLSASRPLLLFASFTYMLASTAHLYMPQLFTHCLPSIICVALMCIVYVVWNNLFIYFLFNCIILRPIYIVSVNIFCHHMFVLHTLFLSELCAWFFPIIWLDGFVYLFFYLFWWFNIAGYVWFVCSTSLIELVCWRMKWKHSGVVVLPSYLVKCYFDGEHISFYMTSSFTSDKKLLKIIF